VVKSPPVADRPARIKRRCMGQLSFYMCSLPVSNVSGPYSRVN
jgi:hypothetical protein